MSAHLTLESTRHETYGCLQANLYRFRQKLALDRRSCSVRYIGEVQILWSRRNQRQQSQVPRIDEPANREMPTACRLGVRGCMRAESVLSKKWSEPTGLAALSVAREAAAWQRYSWM